MEIDGNRWKSKGNGLKREAPGLQPGLCTGHTALERSAAPGECEGRAVLLAGRGPVSFHRAF